MNFGSFLFVCFHSFWPILGSFSANIFRIHQCSILNLNFSSFLVRFYLKFSSISVHFWILISSNFNPFWFIFLFEFWPIFDQFKDRFRYNFSQFLTSIWFISAAFITNHFLFNFILQPIQLDFSHFPTQIQSNSEPILGLIKVKLQSNLNLQFSTAGSTFGFHSDQYRPIPRPIFHFPSPFSGHFRWQLQPIQFNRKIHFKLNFGLILKLFG